ncbi:hypothetical protein QJS10_CPB14g00981 [Acorus calamus]|uniref:Uncharacterized protein n=1 Tax=Acorus calamus TaxID=4465 RepID=A0AAV9DCZ1_ACOCL|nr:hypothetical protein QJS10_CPB14g00981 [Acorus calamus]
MSGTSNDVPSNRSALGKSLSAYPITFRMPVVGIEVQASNHHADLIVSESSISAGGEAETVVRSKIKFAVKRCREPESDNESEVDETVVESLPVLANFNADDHRTSEFWHDSLGPENLGLGSTVFVSFDLENEVPYQKAVDKLISEGKLADALALSDRCLNEGASYELLQLLVENGEEKKANFVQHQGYGSQNFMNDSWQYCLRLKDKHLAARLALKYLHKWDLDAAMDILTMCGCHLPQSDPIRDEVLQMRRALQGHSHILSADDRYKCWQEILKEFPSLRDNNLILTYFAKAIAVSSNSPKWEPQTSVMGTRQKQKSRVGASSWSTFSNTLSNLQEEACSAFSWAPRDYGSKSAP